MKNWNSTDSWKKMNENDANNITSLKSASTLAYNKWPGWAKNCTQMQEIYCIPNDNKSLRIPGSTLEIESTFRTERYDIKDSKHYNYNFYLVAKSTDGDYYSSPPIRPENLKHHSSESLEILLEKLGQPPF